MPHDCLVVHYYIIIIVLTDITIITVIADTFYICIISISMCDLMNLFIIAVHVVHYNRFGSIVYDYYATFGGILGRTCVDLAVTLYLYSLLVDGIGV